MGDRYQRSNAPRDRPVKKLAKESGSKKSRPMLDTSDFVGEYKPRTQETKNAFEVVLSFVQEALGDQASLTFDFIDPYSLFQARDILIGSAEEVLKVLKSEKTRETDKRRDVEALLDPMRDERFAFLCNLAKKITDFDLSIGETQDVSIVILCRPTDFSE